MLAVCLEIPFHNYSTTGELFLRRHGNWFFKQRKTLFTEDMPRDVKKNKRNIAILTQHTLLSHNFDVFFLTGFTDQIRRSGYTMRMFEAVKEELTAGQLPPQPDLSDAAAILCIGLFDLAYLNKVACWDSPCVIVDGCTGASNSQLCYDLISMESHDRTHDFRGREANRLRRL